MKNTKNAFTLAELMIGISILIIIAGLTIPVVKKVLPDTDKKLVKYAYYQISAVIKSLVSDPYIYPTGRFDNPMDYKNPQTGVSYSKNDKFTKAFISKLNVMKQKDLKYNVSWSGSAQTAATSDWNKILGYDDKDIRMPKSITGANSTDRTCILTNNKIYYCLPKVTMTDYPTTLKEGLLKEMYKKTHDRFYEDGSIVISVYLSEDHAIEKGYYFAVNRMGKITLLPTDDVTCFSSKEESCTCATESTYNKYNHCKLYEYLVNIH